MSHLTLMIFALILIDLNNGARTDDRRHALVAYANKTVRAVPQIEMLNQANRNLSPDLHELRQKIRPVEAAELRVIAREPLSSHRFLANPAASWVLAGANIAWSRPKSLRCRPKNAKMFDQWVR